MCRPFFSRIKKDNGRLSKISIKDKKIKVYPYFPAPVFFNKTFSIPKTIFGAISQRRAAGGSPGWTRRPLSLRWTPFTNEGGAGAEGGGRGGVGKRGRRKGDGERGEQRWTEREQGSAKTLVCMQGRGGCCAVCAQESGVGREEEEEID